jgi:hypothetical protein
VYYNFDPTRGIGGNGGQGGFADSRVRAVAVGAGGGHAGPAWR